MKMIEVARRRLVFRYVFLLPYSILLIVALVVCLCTTRTTTTTTMASQLSDHHYQIRPILSSLPVNNNNNFLNNVRHNATTTSGTTTATTHRSGILTIPLIPYSIHRRRNIQLARSIERQRRRRRLLRRNEKNDPMTYNEFYYHAQQVAGLYQGYGSHYVDVWCGTPPQRQTLIIDTGSSITAFPCSQCNDCGVPDYHIDPLFNESASTTFRTLSCDECFRGKCKPEENPNVCSMSQAYQEGSGWTAYEATDSCYVGGLHSSAVGGAISPRTTPSQQGPDDLNPLDATLFKFNLKFGCQTKLLGMFKTQMADGVMGVDFGTTSFWWQMYQSNIIAHKSFSLCYSRQETNITDNATSGAGAISFGGSDPRLHSSTMVYTKAKNKTDDGEGLFTVSIKRVWLRPPGGGTSAKSTSPNSKYVEVDISKTDVPGSRVIIDSGTTDTYFSNEFGVVFSEAWEKMTGTKYENFAVTLPPEELDNTYPTIILQMNGDRHANRAVQEQQDSKNATTSNTTVNNLAYDIDPKHPYDVIIAIPPSHYFEYDEDTKKYISRFYTNDPKGGIIGANVMMGHDINFDIERNRIGWAESLCDYEAVTRKFIADDPSLLTFSKNMNNQNNYKPAPKTGSKRVENMKVVKKVEPTVDSILFELLSDEIKESHYSSGIGGVRMKSLDPFDTEFCYNYNCQIIFCCTFLAIALMITWRLLQRKSSSSRSKNGMQPISGDDDINPSNSGGANGSTSRTKLRHGSSLRHPNSP